mmetsp:Transcript_26493/g.67367  ORF Transcript_26493/g.67367 Transcript_26493/m.67367 type:complete len:223 (+) Transcript_26493:276-944(+)
MAPGQEPRQPRGGHHALQGDQRGVRGAVRPQQARGVRQVRGGGPEAGRARWWRAGVWRLQEPGGPVPRVLWRWRWVWRGRHGRRPLCQHLWWYGWHGGHARYGRLRVWRHARHGARRAQPRAAQGPCHRAHAGGVAGGAVHGRDQEDAHLAHRARRAAGVRDPGDRGAAGLEEGHQDHIPGEGRRGAGRGGGGRGVCAGREAPPQVQARRQRPHTHGAAAAG